MEKPSLIDDLERLYKDGTLHRLVENKMIDKASIVWRNLYHAYHFRTETTGSKMQAYSDVSSNFGFSEDHVRMVLRKLGTLTTNKENT